MFLAFSSPFSNNLIYFSSSSGDNGSGNNELLEIYPKEKDGRTQKT